MTVAVGIFTFVVTSASGLFVMGLKAQRQSLALQLALDQTSYVTEYISRSVRMAKKDDDIGTCTGTAKANYAFSGQCLQFKGYDDLCRQFCLQEGRLVNENGEYLTSADLEVSSFIVNLTGETQDDDIQPKVTLFMEVGFQGQSKVKIQTTISQRNPDVKR